MQNVFVAITDTMYNTVYKNSYDYLTMPFDNHTFNTKLFSCLYSKENKYVPDNVCNSELLIATDKGN